jgi:hypothetical protein
MCSGIAWLQTHDLGLNGVLVWLRFGHGFGHGAGILVVGALFVVITFNIYYSYMNTSCMAWLNYGHHFAHN